MNYREPKLLKSIELKNYEDTQELLTLDIYESEIIYLVYENFKTGEFIKKLITDQEEKEIYQKLL